MMSFLFAILGWICLVISIFDFSNKGDWALMAIFWLLMGVYFEIRDKKR